jgi:hypothetical protein
MSFKMAAPAARQKSKQGPLSLSAKAMVSKYFREDSNTTQGAGGISDLKDLEADSEFEMLALDGSAIRNTI